MKSGKRYNSFCHDRHCGEFYEFGWIFQLHLSKLETVREEDINREIHNIQCIYNALSDIKAEVENVIKVGRKIVENNLSDSSAVKVDDHAESSTREKLTAKIDALKEEFNDAGNEVSESQHRLETILTLSQKCTSLLASIKTWLDKNESFELVAVDRTVTDSDVNAIASKLFEMSKYKYSFVELNR